MENGSDGSSPRKTISSRASLRQLMPAILDGPGDFAHPIRTGRNLVFKLDGRLDKSGTHLGAFSTGTSPPFGEKRCIWIHRTSLSRSISTSRNYFPGRA